MTNEVKVPTRFYHDRIDLEYTRDMLSDMAEVKGFVTVEDFATASFCLISDWSDEYGWTKDMIYDARIRRNPEGFYLDLPEPVKVLKEETL